MFPRFSHRLDNIQLSMIRQIMQKAEGCSNLGIGEPDFFAPLAVRNEARRVIDQEKIQYSPNAGLAELQHAVASYHGRLADYAVCICNGSQEALFDIIFALVDPGEEVLVPNPGFVAYATIVRLAGAVAVPYRLPARNDFRLDHDHMAGLFSDRTKAVILNTPSNPTGQVLTEDDLEFITRLADSHGALVISDEIYREIYYGGHKPPGVLEGHSGAVVISGVSKMASMTGWRIGWAYGPRAVIEKTTVMHQYTSSCASSLSQKAALSVFSEDGMREVAGLRRQLAENCSLVCSFLDSELKRRFVRPQGAFYVMVDVSDLGESLSVALRLLRDQVATIPGAAFGSEGEGFLRISFASEPETLEQGLERLRRSDYFCRRQ
jgi:aspartate/methionine/tyrosine aminotransferase